MARAPKSKSGSRSAAAAVMGKAGGPARARALSAGRRSQIASLGGKAQKKSVAWQRGARGAAKGK